MNRVERGAIAKYIRKPFSREWSIRQEKQCAYDKTRNRLAIIGETETTEYKARYYFIYYGDSNKIEVSRKYVDTIPDVPKVYAGTKHLGDFSISMPDSNIAIKNAVIDNMHEALEEVKRLQILELKRTEDDQAKLIYYEKLGRVTVALIIIFCVIMTIALLVTYLTR